MESVSQDSLRQILLKLPTRDVGRCRQVCKRWCLLLTSPSFLALHAHAAHVVSGAGAEGLVVHKTYRTRVGADKIPQFVLFNLSSATPMCRFSDLDTPNYRPANACNGFLCLGSHVQGAPLVVCNPITGEKLRIPAPRKAESMAYVDWHLFGMGFSPSTRQYKLFHISFPGTSYEKAYLDVCTLDGNARWRGRHLHLRSNCHKMRSEPVLINGKLYVVTAPMEPGSKLDGILAIDVGSEAVCTHSLPKQRVSGAKTTVDTMELHGQLCVAIHDFKMPSPRLTFWVLRTTMEDQNKKGDDDMWELRYSFYLDAHDCSHYQCCYRCECHPRGAWLDDSDGVLCYLSGGYLYKYDTTVKHRSQYPSTLPASSDKEWDHRLRLQPSDRCYRWNVYGGYRPSLLSPRHFATSLSSLQRDEQPPEHPLLQTMPSRTPSKKRIRSPCPTVDNGTDNRRDE